MIHKTTHSFSIEMVKDQPNDPHTIFFSESGSEFTEVGLGVLRQEGVPVEDPTSFWYWG